MGGKVFLKRRLCMPFYWSYIQSKKKLCKFLFFCLWTLTLYTVLIELFGHLPVVDGKLNERFFQRPDLLISSVKEETIIDRRNRMRKIRKEEPPRGNFRYTVLGGKIGQVPPCTSSFIPPLSFSRRIDCLQISKHSRDVSSTKIGIFTLYSTPSKSSGSTDEKNRNEREKSNPRKPANLDKRSGFTNKDTDLRRKSSYEKKKIKDSKKSLRVSQDKERSLIEGERKKGNTHLRDIPSPLVNHTLSTYASVSQGITEKGDTEIDINQEKSRSKSTVKDMPSVTGKRLLGSNIEAAKKGLIATKGGRRKAMKKKRAKLYEPMESDAAARIRNQKSKGKKTRPDLFVDGMSFKSTTGSVFNTDKFPSLVLNANFQALSYTPLSVWSMEDAFKAVYSNRVDVVSHYEGAYIKSTNQVWQIPSVIVLREYIDVHKDSPALNRRNIYIRDGFCCQYCNSPLLYSDATLDHVVPRCRGGKLSWENIVTCCKNCNNRKGHLDLKVCQKLFNMRLRREPIKPTCYQMQQMAMSKLRTQKHLNGIPEAWRSWLVPNYGEDNDTEGSD